MNPNEQAEKTFSELVGESLGRASVAWSETPKGIFESDECACLHIDIMNEHERIVAESKKAGRQEAIDEMEARIKALEGELIRMHHHCFKSDAIFSESSFPIAKELAKENP